jgi:hypothetical protein
LFFVLGWNCIYAQQIIDTIDVEYWDNVQGSGNPNLWQTPVYSEFPGINWPYPYPSPYGYSSNSSNQFYYGGLYRRTNPNGTTDIDANVKFYINIPTQNHYILYHNMYASKSPTNAYARIH